MRRGAVVGAYELIEQAAAGGMGTVWRARDRAGARDVAIKVIAGSDPADQLRFAREIEVLSRLEHPGILAYLAHGETEDGTPWLATEWLEGRDLGARLRAGRIGLYDVLTIGVEVARVLGAAHAAGVVHRDVKPTNVFLLARGGIKLLDFGVARREGDAMLTSTGTSVGTPGYMSPEQARGRSVLDGRADVFSLGCVLHECLAGEPAFPGHQAIAVLAKVLLEDVAPLSSRVSGLPPALVSLVSSCLEKDPARRPSGALEVAERLDEIRASVTATRRTSTAPPVAPPTADALGDAEQRVVVAILAASPLAADPVDLDPGSSRALDTDAKRPALLAERHGARLEALVDGTIAALVTDGTSATDLASRAARLARDLSLALAGSRVAIATGRAVIGDRLPASGAIDAAAELLRAAASPAAIALDTTTARLLGTRFEIGVDGSVATLLGEHALEEPQRLMGKRTRFVGRKRELAALEALLAESAEESVARAALIVGESGIGKTRLLRELLARAEHLEPAPQVWLARCEPHGAGAALGIVASLVRHAAAIRAAEPAAKQHAKLRARVRRRVSPGVAERVTTFLAEALGVGLPATTSVQLFAARGDPRLMGDQIRRAFEDLLEAECAAAPVLIAVDDLQWGDRPSVELLDRALRNLARRPVAVLGLARPELRSALGEPWRERALTQIRLEGIPDRAAETFVRDAIEGAADDDVARIVASARGNAFYLEELVRACAEGRDRELPPTVLAMAHARLGALPPGQRRALRAASVLGETFWSEAVHRLVGASHARGDVDDDLERLERAEVIERRRRSRFPRQHEWAFRHATVHEAAYAMLTDDDRRIGHRLAGEWLEEAGEQDSLRLAEHFELGGAAERAISWWRRAAELALEGDDLPGAIARADRGVAAGARGEELGALRLVQAQAHAWRGAHPEARALALGALEELRPPDERWYRALDLATGSGFVIGARDALETADRLLSEQPPGPAWARTLARLAVSSYQVGDDARAVRAIERLLAAPEHVRSTPDVRASILRARASRAAREGDEASCLEHLARAGAAQLEAGSQRSACVERMNCAVLETSLGLYEEAEAHLVAVLADAERMGLALIVPAARMNLAHVHARLGRHAEARRALTDLVTVFEERGDKRLSGAVRIYLSQALLGARAIEGAEREARAGVELLEGAPPVRPWALATLAEALLARGAAGEALAVAEEAHRTLEGPTKLEVGEARIRIVLAEALAAAGRAEDAAAARTRARESLLARAARITRPEWRESFLARVDEHARTLA